MATKEGDAKAEAQELKKALSREPAEAHATGNVHPQSQKKKMTELTIRILKP